MNVFSKFKKCSVLMASVALLVTPTILSAEQYAVGSKRDHRIRTFTYYPDDVYVIKTATGYAVNIVFDAGERIENVTAGDDVSWRFAKLDREDRMTVQALSVPGQPTSMTVHTNRRIYSFLIAAKKGSSPRNVGLRYSFNYKKSEAKTKTARKTKNIFHVFNNSKIVNAAYSATGSRNLRPDQTFDDFKKTYIRLRSPVRPAVFAVGSDGRERLVNTSDLEDGTIVVHGVYAKLVLRNGPDFICIFNTTLFEKKQPKTPKPDNDVIAVNDQRGIQ